MYGEPTLVQQGWQCPICGRVYSPSTPSCYNCGPQNIESDNKTVPIQYDNYYKTTCECSNFEDFFASMKKAVDEI